MAKRSAKRSVTGQRTRQGFLSAPIAEPDVRDYVIAELRYDSPATFTRSKFVAPSSAAPLADSLNQVLEKFDIEGWGWHVTTLGYGDAQGGASENTWYTLRFSGTSSASPIVTGAVACLQGRAKAKDRRLPDAAESPPDPDEHGNASSGGPRRPGFPAHRPAREPTSRHEADLIEGSAA